MEGDYTTDFHPFFAISANSANPAGICGNRGVSVAISASINAENMPPANFADSAGICGNRGDFAANSASINVENMPPANFRETSVPLQCVLAVHTSG